LSDSIHEVEYKEEYINTQDLWDAEQAEEGVCEVVEQVEFEGERE
jgi:hypothetical protein